MKVYFTGMKRNLTARIELLLTQFPIVAILGARQVGKTTLAKLLRPKWHYVDLQQQSVQTRILSDPEMFFKDYAHSVILDEAQSYPILFNTLRGVIDADRQVNGRFIITGSSSPDLLKYLSESLAGRIAIIELGTLKSNEVADTPLSDFYSWFKLNLLKVEPRDLKINTNKISQHFIQKTWFNGGYPEIVLASDEAKQQNWFEFYEQTYLYRDVVSLFPTINKQNFQRFFRTLAHLSGTILNKAQCARDLEISQNSVQNYLNILEGTFLWQNLKSFERKSYKSLVKMPKGYFADSGLLHYLNNIMDIDALKQHPIMGRSFEGFVIGEIIKGLKTLSIGHWDLFHYRTKHGAEIDLIIEGRFGIVPIEIKYGIKIVAKQLLSLNNFINENKLNFGIIINQADNIEWITPQILQIPIGYI